MPKTKKETKGYALTDNQRALRYYVCNPVDQISERLEAVSEGVKRLCNFFDDLPADYFADFAPSLVKVDKALREAMVVLSEWEEIEAAVSEDI